MAQKVVSYIVYTDDLTGEQYEEGQGETVAYGLDNRGYEIDLTAANAKELREFLARYVPVSRKTYDNRGRPLSAVGGSVSGSRRSKRDMEAVRAWAAENGYNVPAKGKGRIPWGVTQAYERATAKKTED